MTTANTPKGFVPEWTAADRLRKVRELLGLNQSELAAMVGYSRATLAGIEQGVRTPRRGVLLAVAFATGVDFEWLETGKTPAEHACGGDGGGPCGARTHDLRIKSP